VDVKITPDFCSQIAKLAHFYHPVNAWWRNKNCIEINLLIINLFINLLKTIKSYKL